jgi:hypothetical protein
MSENGDYQDSGAEFKRDRYIEIYVEAHQPELLEGLEELLRLGLISSGQVKKIARQRLSCTLPLPEVVASIPVSAEISNLNNPSQVVVKATEPHALQRIFQSFLDELSIRWLLFLGIFLVVVSSGVLAANQWQSFPSLGQYLVLLVYTLGFWGVGFWTGKQALKFTSQTLTAIAILLIPINFWAISHLGLGRNSLELGIIVVTVISLTAVSYLAFPRSNSLWWLRLLFCLLSYLHFGWQIPHFPLLAIYGGMVVIWGTHAQFLLPRRKYPLVDLLFILAAWSLLLARILITATYTLPNYSLAIAIFAWLIATIYLSQARKIKAIALKHKSAAITNAFLGKVGKICCIILFVFSWLVSINVGLLNSPLYFWQTVGISALAIHLFSQRLSLYWRKSDLTALFFIGLQTLYVCKELIPDGWRDRALDLSVAVSKTEYFPESVLGVTLFPYVILFVLIASWLYQRQKTQLALYSEYLTLILGILLTCLSVSNPTWRSLNLLLSTLTLGYVARIRQPMRSTLVYFTHLLGLIALVNAIAVIFPNLDRAWWGSILLALMTIEWSFYLSFYLNRLGQKRSRVATLTRQSCWYFGLLLSAISYTCLAAVRETPPGNSTASSDLVNSSYWGLIWLTTPVMLSLIAKYTPNIRQRRLATVISCLALILVQLLIFEQLPARLLSLGAATGLMFVNAFNLRRTIITIIHLGLAIALIASLFDPFIGNNLNDYRQWLSVGGIIILLLYQLRLLLLKTSNAPQFGYISQRTAFGILGVGRETQNFKLVSKYLQAADYWAIFLMAIALVIVSVLYLVLPSLKIDLYFGHYFFTTALLIGAIFWRYRDSPNNLVLYTITWLSAIFAGVLVRLFVSSSFVLALSNIILGLVALVIVVLLAQSNTPWARLNLSSIPLVYAVGGIFWRLSSFNTYTGLLTLGAALILLNTQQNHHQIDRLFKYLGFAGISGGIYELVIYQMQSASGGSIADSFTILSLVAAAIALSYRLLSWWYRQRELTTLFNLGLSQVVPIAHIHWAMSSIFKIIGAGIALETNTSRLTIVSIAISFCLGAYAVIQGRNLDAAPKQNKDQRSKPAPSFYSGVISDWWVYVGLVEIAATLVYSRLIISRLSLFDPWRLVFTCAISLLIYQIPWQNFGWRTTPWQRTALIIPALMALITAEDISAFSLLITALFYLRIAYAQRNIRWSYISLGFVNWLAIRIVVEQTNTQSILVAGIISLSILYLAQFDPAVQSRRQIRHYLRLLGSSIFCTTALFEQPGIIPGAIAFSFIFVGLGLRIRAFLFTGTVTLILTVLHQLIILVFTYSFLKWVVGLLTGISSIAIAAGFENKRDRLSEQLKRYRDRLHSWQ